jgi:hypothetical protein
MSRLEDIIRFYALLDRLEQTLGGKRRLEGSSGKLNWPQRGVYFFFEPGENRTDSGRGPRVVRIGTHALNAGSQTSLWSRLSQHRGTGSNGGGNHRGSIFRLLVGTVIKKRDGLDLIETWGVKSDKGQAAAQFGLSREQLRAIETPLEIMVSRHIRSFPFLWLRIDDEAGPESDRSFIERNSIALLSNYEKTPIDPYSADWLGRHADRPKVRSSGLWNNNHVDEAYQPDFLARFEALIAKCADHQ